MADTINLEWVDRTIFLNSENEKIDLCLLSANDYLKLCKEIRTLVLSYRMNQNTLLYGNCRFIAQSDLSDGEFELFTKIKK